MANDLRKNPWKIDTASTNYLRSGTTIPAGGASSGKLAGGGAPGVGNPGADPGPFLGRGPIIIASIQWTGNAATTDTVVIQDENGNTFLTLVSKSDKSIVEVNYDRPLRKWDIVIPTLASGIVAINLW